MPDRLSALDASFLYLEEPTTAMHVGWIGVFQTGPDGFDHDRLVRLVTERIAFVPRHRQRLRWVPGRLANPVWVDDERFDVTYHVRRSALPRPGRDDQLAELVARIMSRRLDRSRPLWEMYLIEGLSDGRFAILSKTHHAMVDGVTSLALGQVVLDTSPQPHETPAGAWHPAPEPSGVELVAGALVDILRRPTGALDTLRTGLADVGTAVRRVAGAAGGLLAVARSAARPIPESPLNAAIGEQRRYATVAIPLEDFKRVRAVHGGTVNDALLATVSGALRTWLLGRGASVNGSTVVRALVPVSVRVDGVDGPAVPGDGSVLDGHPGADGRTGHRVASLVVELPVGEPSAVIRLHRVSFAMQAHQDTGHAVGAPTLAGIAGFAPPTLHALGARVASGLSRRMFDLVVTNVPGPQVPLYAAGSRMLAAYPVVPLARGQALGIGMTSYDGNVFFGLNADRDAMPDVAELATLLVEAAAELDQTVVRAHRRRRS